MDKKVIGMWVGMALVIILAVVAGVVYQGTATNQQNASDRMITSFAFTGLVPSVSGTIDAVHHTIAMTVVQGTNIKSLSPVIAV